MIGADLKIINNKGFKAWNPIKNLGDFKMTDFIDSNGISYNDFNDTFTFNVCVMQALYSNNLEEPDEWNCAPETLKIFNPDQQNEAGVLGALKRKLSVWAR